MPWLWRAALAAVLLAACTDDDGNRSTSPPPTEAVILQTTTSTTEAPVTGQPIVVVEQGVSSFPDPFDPAATLGGYGVVLENPNPEVMAAGVHVSGEIRSYIVRLCDATRQMTDVLRLGVSTRGAIALMKCSRTLAAAQARTFVTADDVKSVAHAVMEHRMLLTPQAELSGVRTEDLVERVLKSVEAPGAVRAAH